MTVGYFRLLMVSSRFAYSHFACLFDEGEWAEMELGELALDQAGLGEQGLDEPRLGKAE